ncbi:unnamed protein product [Sphagnum balticum]
MNGAPHAAKATNSGPSIVTDTEHQRHPRMQRKMTLKEERGGAYFMQRQLRTVPRATQLEHNCALNIDDPPYLVRKTGIICTIGPEIRTGLLAGGASAEIELVKGQSIRLACDDSIKICQEAETAIYHSRYFEELMRITPRPTDTSNTIAIAAVSASVLCRAAAIVLITTSGRLESGALQRDRLLQHWSPFVPMSPAVSNHCCHAQSTFGAADAFEFRTISVAL